MYARSLLLLDGVVVVGGGGGSLLLKLLARRPLVPRVSHPVPWLFVSSVRGRWRYDTDEEGSHKFPHWPRLFRWSSPCLCNTKVVVKNIGWLIFTNNGVWYGMIRYIIEGT